MAPEMGKGQTHGNLYLAVGKNAKFVSGVLERGQETEKMKISMGCRGGCVQAPTWPVQCLISLPLMHQTPLQLFIFPKNKNE